MIIHIAGVELSENTGMGRIAVEWQKAFERRGQDFKHIATGSFSNRKHRLLDGWLARRFIINQGWQPDLIIAHEPTAGWLKFKHTPLVTFSHGIEERGAQQQETYQYGFQVKSKKAFLLPDKLRYWSHDRGFRLADLRLLSNEADRLFLMKEKNCHQPSFIFRNGYHEFQNNTSRNTTMVFLFNGTWLPRKGTAVLTKAFNAILRENRSAKLILAGTGLTGGEIVGQFETDCQAQVEVIPSFTASMEEDIYQQANIYVLPSFFEGQSLALTQAMAMGLCPIAADNSGQVDIIKHEKNGLLFKTGDADDLHAKISMLLNDQAMLSRLQDQAAQSVKHLTWPAVADEVAEQCLRFL